MTLRERLRGWRTIIWNSLIAFAAVALPIIDQFSIVDWSRVFTPGTVALILFTLSVVGVILRIITTTPVGGK